MSRYAAHAEMCAAIYARERADVMQDVVEIFPTTTEYPISGDMLAVVLKGSGYERRQRRRRASAERQQTR